MLCTGLGEGAAAGGVIGGARVGAALDGWAAAPDGWAAALADGCAAAWLTRAWRALCLLCGFLCLTVGVGEAAWVGVLEGVLDGRAWVWPLAV